MKIKLSKQQMDVWEAHYLALGVTWEKYPDGALDFGLVLGRHKYLVEIEWGSVYLNPDPNE